MIIKVIHTVDRKVYETPYQGALTPRRLAKAYRIARKEHADIDRRFGPGVISPKHNILCQVIDEDDNTVVRDVVDFAAGLIEDGASWSDVTADLRGYAESGVEMEEYEYA